jgi:secreted trypsin-like serine protease
MAGDQILAGCVSVDDPACRPIALAKVLVSAQWSESTMSNDWALARLEKPHGLTPGRLPLSKMSTSAGTQVVAVGFGRTTKTGPTSRFLLETPLTTFDHGACAAHLSKAGRVDESMLCTLERDSASCNGDSGAGLMLADSLEVIGITSWGIGCMDPEYPLGVSAYIPAFRADLEACLIELGRD